MRQDGQAQDGQAQDGKTPWKTELRKDKLIRWCSCGLSARQPFCDDKHVGANFLPVLLRADADMTVALCGCKLTGRPPYCDGAHINLPKQVRAST